MSTVIRNGNIRIAILTNDHEPAHCHAIGPDAEAKILLEPVALVWSYGFSPAAVRTIMELVETHQNELKEKWNEYHGKDEGEAP